MSFAKYKPRLTWQRKQEPDPLRRLVQGHGAGDEPGSLIHHVMTAEDATQFVLRGLGIAILAQARAWRITRNRITIGSLYVDGLSLKTRLACRANSQMQLVSDFCESFCASSEGTHECQAASFRPCSLATAPAIESGCRVVRCANRPCIRFPL